MGQREMTQPTVTPQPPVVGAKTGAQSQVGSSSGPQHGGQPGRPQTAARVYAMTQQQAQATLEVVTGILSIFNANARILIDSSVTHCFVANSYVMHLGRESKKLDMPMIVSTLVGETLRINEVYPGCLVMVQKYELPVDLSPLEMYDFDVILGMDWLSKHNMVIDCFSKTVTFKKSGDMEFSFQGERKILPFCLISWVAVNRCL